MKKCGFSLVLVVSHLIALTPIAKAGSAIINVELSDRAVAEMTRILKDEGAKVVPYEKSKKIDIQVNLSAPTTVFRGPRFQRDSVPAVYFDQIADERSFDRFMPGHVECLRRQMGELREALLTEAGQLYLARDYNNRTLINLTIKAVSNLEHLRIANEATRLADDSDLLDQVQKVIKADPKNQSPRFILEFDQTSLARPGGKVWVILPFDSQATDVAQPICPQTSFIGREELVEHFVAWNSKWQARFGTDSSDAKVRAILNQHSRVPLK